MISSDSSNLLGRSCLLLHFINQILDSFEITSLLAKTNNLYLAKPLRILYIKRGRFTSPIVCLPLNKVSSFYSVIRILLGFNSKFEFWVLSFACAFNKACFVIVRCY